MPICPVTSPAALTNKFNATMAPTATNDSTQGYAAGSRWYDMNASRAYVCVNSSAGAAVWNFLGMQDVSAIVVALGILDATSENLVATKQVTVGTQTRLAPDLSGLVGIFADASINDVVNGSGSSQLYIPNLAPPAAGMPARLMAEAWTNQMMQSGFVQKSGIPPRAAAQVRIYQRSFPLNNQE